MNRSKTYEFITIMQDGEIPSALVWWGIAIITIIFIALLAAVFAFQFELI